MVKRGCKTYFNADLFDNIMTGGRSRFDAALLTLSLNKKDIPDVPVKDLIEYILKNYVSVRGVKTYVSTREIYRTQNWRNGTSVAFKITFSATKNWMSFLEITLNTPVQFVEIMALELKGINHHIFTRNRKGEWSDKQDKDMSDMNNLTPFLA